MAGTEMDMVGVSNPQKLVFGFYSKGLYESILISVCLYRMSYLKSSMRALPTTRVKWLEW
jgi:hypothetical protein